MSLWPALAAADGGHSEVCSLLLDAGSDLEERHPGTLYTSLHNAALYGHHALVQLLLRRGALVDSLDHTGSSALHMACQEGHLTVALSLLQAGASLTLADRGGVWPIHLAAGENRTAVV